MPWWHATMDLVGSGHPNLSDALCKHFSQQTPCPSAYREAPGLHSDHYAKLGHLSYAKRLEVSYLMGTTHEFRFKTLQRE